MSTEQNGVSIKEAPMGKVVCCIWCGRDTRNKSQICTRCNKERREDLKQHSDQDGTCWWLDEEDDADIEPIDVEWLIDRELE